MRPISVILYESLQNLPLGVGFVFAVVEWRAGNQVAAMAWVVAGALASSLLIRFTEPRIIASRPEPWRVTGANAVAMALLMILLAIYMSAGWGGYTADLIIGLVAGSAVGALQSIVARESLRLGHCLALGLAASFGLASARFLILALPPLAAAALTTCGASLVVALIDYRPDQSRTATRGEVSN